MKKKVIIIIIIVAVAAAAIIIGSLYYPPTKGDDSSGTIGKAEKFRKGQFTAEDILLRDDILKDTAAVGKTLDQIFAYSSFMVQEKLIIDSIWIKEIKKNCPTYPGCTNCVNCEKSVKLLQDYSNFLENNKETIKKVVDVLLNAYNGKSKDVTFDVGVKLLSFVQFIDEMVKRDSVLTTSINLVDQYINQEKGTNKKREAEISRLKKVRDKMVIDNLLFAMKTGDKKQTEVASSYSLVGTAQYLSTGSIESSGSLEIIDIVTAAIVVGSTGVYSAGRLDAAMVNSVPYCNIDNGQVVRNDGSINAAVGLDVIVPAAAGSISNVETVRNLVGVGYQNIVEAAPLSIIYTNAGTIFSTGVFSAALMTE